MKIPSSVKVGSCVYRIERRSYQTESDMDGGYCDWENNVIFVASNMPEDRQAVTFLHELLHAINIYLSEVEVTAISEGLMQVIKDNKIDFLNDDRSVN